ncbi:MAG: extracellular solute-binding protein, partial [Chloroflexota bacterium]
MKETNAGKEKLRLTRRELLVALGAGAASMAAAACGGPAAAPAPTQAPAKAAEPAKPAAEAPKAQAPAAAATQAPSKIAGASLAILQGSYFDRAWQDFAKKMFEDWGAQNNVKLTVDFLAWPDLQPKIGAAIQAGGIDVVEMWPGWNYLYQNSLVEVTDIAKEVEQAGGGWEEYVINSAPVGEKWYGVPHGESGGLIAYRIGWFKEAIEALGMTKFKPEDSSTMDMTWDEYFQIGGWLKKNKGKAFGQAFGHSTGDPPGFAYPYMWSNGAMEREKDLKTVAINKPEFLEALKKFQQGWKDAFVEAGTSWDDAANNKAYLAGEISSTYNGSSIYFTAKRDYKEIAADSNHMLLPKGAKTGQRYIRHGTRQLGILKNSKNIEAAKAFLRWFMSDQPYGDWFRVHAGYMTGNTKKWAKDPMWEQDRKVTIYRDVPKYGRVDGYAGPTDAKAAEVYSKYIIVDMYAKIASGTDPEAALK